MTDIAITTDTVDDGVTHAKTGEHDTDRRYTNE